MNLSRHISVARHWLNRLLAGLALAGCLTANVVAVAPDWHAWLHAEAGEHDDAESPHECAATLLANGLLDATAGPPPEAFAGRGLILLPPPPLARLATTFTDRFPPGRAPPGSPHVHDPRHSS